LLCLDSATAKKEKYQPLKALDIPPKTEQFFLGIYSKSCLKGIGEQGLGFYLWIISLAPLFWHSQGVPDNSSFTRKG
jgi:hypothetical protein